MPFYINSNDIQQLNNLISDLKKSIIINLFKYKEKNVIKIILTKDLEYLNAAEILSEIKKNFHCEGNGNKKIANGIIFNKINNNEIISYVQLYLQKQTK